MSIERFKKYLAFEKHYSLHTIKAYNRDLNQFFLFSKEVFEINGEIAMHFHIRAWVVQLMQSGISARTINRKVSVLRTYFKYLQKQGNEKTTQY